MLMTEQEAKGKRCTPMAAPAVLLYLASEKYNEAIAADVLKMRCIGSQCAQWCWYDYVDDAGSTHHAAGESRPYTKGRATPSQMGTKTEPRPGRGYCGLTGARE